MVEHETKFVAKVSKMHIVMITKLYMVASNNKNHFKDYEVTQDGQEV